MFFVSKFFQFMVLPPGCLIIFLIFIAVMLYKKKYRVCKFFLTTLVLVLYIFSTSPVANLLLLPLENSYPGFFSDEKNNNQTNEKDYDYIVILGGGAVHNSPDENGKGSLPGDSMQRLVYGCRLHRKNNLPIIVSGGRVYDKDNVESEAEIARRILIELGVKGDKIFIEDKSRNTWENANKIKEKYSPERVILVTSAYHMRRSVFCFSGNKIKVSAAPTGFKARRKEFNFFSFIPSMSSLSNSYLAMREYLGLIFYKIKY